MRSTRAWRSESGDQPPSLRDQRRSSIHSEHASRPRTCCPSRHHVCCNECPAQGACCSHPAGSSRQQLRVCRHPMGEKGGNANPSQRPVKAAGQVCIRKSQSVSQLYGWARHKSTSHAAHYQQVLKGTSHTRTHRAENGAHLCDAADAPFRRLVGKRDSRGRSIDGQKVE